MDKGQILIKILSVGDSQVGKSCLIKKYCEGRFVSKYITTIGVDYGVKKMTLRGKRVAINFFDLSGDDDYETISKEFYKDSQGILLVYDITNKDSYLNILTKWENKMKAYGLDGKKCAVYLVGNKADLKGKLFDSLFNKVMDILENTKGFSEN